jgi:hypothetical protein
MHLNVTEAVQNLRATFQTGIANNNNKKVTSQLD